MDKEYTAEIQIDDADTGAVVEMVFTVYAPNKRAAVSAFAALCKQVGAMTAADVRESVEESE